MNALCDFDTSYTSRTRSTQVQQNQNIQQIPLSKTRYDNVCQTYLSTTTKNESFQKWIVALSISFSSPLYWVDDDDYDCNEILQTLSLLGIVSLFSMDHHDDDNDDDCDYNFCSGGNDNDNKDESHCKTKKDHGNFHLFYVAMMRLCSVT